MFGCRCPPPAPHSYSRVFPSSSKHIQSNSGQYPIFEKEGRIKRKKKKKTQLQPYAARTRTVDDARENAEVTVPTPQVLAVGRGGLPTPLQAATPPAGFSPGDGAGAEGSRRGRRQSWERSACPPGQERLRWGGVLKAAGGRAPPATPRGEGVWGPSCAAAWGRPSENKTGSRPSLARQHKPKTPSGKG